MTKVVMNKFDRRLNTKKDIFIEGNIVTSTGGRVILVTTSNNEPLNKDSFCGIILSDMCNSLYHTGEYSSAWDKRQHKQFKGQISIEVL